MRAAHHPAINNIYKCTFLASSCLGLLRIRTEATSPPSTSTHHNLGLHQTCSRKNFFPAVDCHTYTVAFCTLFGVWVSLGDRIIHFPAPWSQGDVTFTHTHISFAKVDFEATKNEINKSHLGKGEGEKNNPPTR